MKTYTFYTQSHESLLNDWFIPSFVKTQTNNELIVKKFDQKCESGAFMSEGWNDSMFDKIEYVLHSIDDTPKNEFFIHADCDIQFFKDINEDLKSINFEMFDIVAQADGPDQICCGFMLIRSNDKTRTVFKEIIDLVKHKKYNNDQIALNAIYRKFGLNVGLLSFKYYSTWMSCPGLWNGQPDPINNIPNNLVLHHANYTIGIDNKIKLLNMVKNAQSINT